VTTGTEPCSATESREADDADFEQYPHSYRIHSASFRNFRIITVRKDTYHVTPFWEFSSGAASWSCIPKSEFIPFFALVCRRPYTILFALHTCLRAELTIVMVHVESRGFLPCSESSVTTCHRLRSSAHRAGSVFVNAPPLRTFVYLRVDWVGERGAGVVTCRATIFPGRVLDCFGRAVQYVFSLDAIAATLI